MLFNSYHFLCFFPLVVLFYFAIPKKARWIWLLITSYYFYGCWHASHIVLLAYATGVSWLAGLLLKKTKHKKVIMALSVMACFASLFTFKYVNWVTRSINDYLISKGSSFTLPALSIALPMGISFYTFQAVSYIVDVYRGKTIPEKNPFRYALYVSFFPQLVAGPIERSERLLPQIQSEHSFSFERLREGFCLMLFGFFQKLVIADRASIFVDTVYNNINEYGGMFALVATIFFAIQIYCDFSGYSLIAMGAAKILGFELMENFDAPYMSKSIAEFWRRWHISLSSWFKDYLYIPLGGSRKGKIRKYVNVMIVFLVSGLWHGADLSYIIWGGLNGLYQIIEELVFGITRTVKKAGNVFINIFKMIITFVLVDIAWIFFRAENTKAAIAVIKSIINNMDTNIFSENQLFTAGLDEANFILLMIAIFILIVFDVLKNKKISIYGYFVKQPTFIRCMELIVVILFIAIFGRYGSDIGSSFIYFQF